MTLRLAPIAFALSIASLAPSGHAGVLDFNYTQTQLVTSASNGLGPLLALGNGGWISQAYGDVAGLVDMSYR
ncbi:MAG: hypothetical protein LW768_07395, partial [Rubrivivax sp.]|nr:hypothetical protein [Rubrivivax sp.]